MENSGSVSCGGSVGVEEDDTRDGIDGIKVHGMAKTHFTRCAASPVAILLAGSTRPVAYA